MELAGKIALITGAAQGIGRAISIEMAKEGALVVMGDIKENILKETYERDVAPFYTGKKIKGYCLRLDVTNEKQIENGVDEVLNRIGRIDILVNCAGVLSSYSITELDEREWNRILDINLKGTFLVTKVLLKRMISQKAGRIINIASDSGITGKKYLSHYCASKFGVIGFTQSAAKEVAEYGISVNAICPGPVVTELYHTDRNMQSKIKGIAKDKLISEENKQIPLGRPGQPEEVARLAIFLASDAACYITGESINISGGLEMH